MQARTFSALAAAALIALASHSVMAAEFTGPAAPLGQGTVSGYAVLGETGAPIEIGVAFSAGALDGLPDRRNNSSRCFDLDGNGVINETRECEGDYQTNLALPAEIAGRDDIPFVFAMVNWNPEGHPPAAWAPPHFDIHFYQVPEAAVEAIRVGSCGIFIDCDDFQRAIKPVPAKYVHPDHVSVEAAVGRMGNHLIDSQTPELGTPPKPFTHTWIFGAEDGRIIFHEIMTTQAFMALGPDTCRDIKQPEAWEQAGYYPTRYCFRHGEDGGLKVFMNGFVLRPAG
jgi:hypothetical protein